MNAERTKKPKSKLRIFAGVGDGIEIDAQSVAQYSGQSIYQAIASVTEQFPELRAMLEDPRLALEVFGSDADGALHESPVSPSDPFEQVLDLLEEADVELGIARSHAGGHKNSSGNICCDSKIARRFPSQQVVCHSAEYKLTAEDHAAVQKGNAVYLTGEVLAQVEFICRELGSQEALWYYLANADDPHVIRDLIIPVQESNFAYCEVEGSDVIRVARQARKLKCKVVGAGHSHGRGSLFSSGTDRHQMSNLAEEHVGRISWYIRNLENTNVRSLSNGNSDTQVFEVDLDKQGLLSIRFRKNGNDSQHLTCENLDIKLRQKRCRIISLFSTHNYWQKHFFPLLNSDFCPACGSRREVYIDAENLEVHIVGPVKISKAKKRSLRQELKEKVQSRALGQYGEDDVDSGLESIDHDYDFGFADMENEDEEEGSKAQPFTVYHEGCLVAKIPWDIMKKATSQSGVLAEAFHRLAGREAVAANKEIVNG